MAWPVIARDAGEQSHSTVCATSSGVTKRPCGLPRASSARASFCRAAGLGNDVGDGIFEQRRVGEARTDRVHGHRMAREFDAERAHQADDAMLGRAIGRDIGIAFQSGRRRNEDDAAALLLRRLRVTSAMRGLHGEKRAGEIDVDHALPMREIDLAERRAVGSARIGNDDIDRAVGLARRRDHRGAVRFAS